MGRQVSENGPAFLDRERLTPAVKRAMETRGLLTVKQAAKLVKLTPVAIYRAAALGKVSHWRVEDEERGSGHDALMFKIEELEAWRGVRLRPL